MKITPKLLKEMIRDVLENQTMLLDEPSLFESKMKSKYDRIIATLEGRTPEVKTVGMMSAQNPMAKASSEVSNALRKGELEAELKKRGLGFERIGGVFGGHPEQSVLILNPSLFDLDHLSRKFQQWGFVWGERYPMNEHQDFMGFKMYMVDYSQNMGSIKAPGSVETSRVMKNLELKGADDNFSFDPTSGKRFGMQMYEEE